MMRRLPLIVAFAISGFAEVKSGRFQNRDAWTVDSARLRVTILQSGGHIGEIVLKEGAAVNPLWIQTHPTIDPDSYDPASHEKFYGGGSGARLMSGLLGHNVCFPFWGDPSPREAAAGMTFHGETGVVRWRRIATGSDSLTVSAELPESRTRFTRTLRVKGQVVSFEETAENETGWDRPVGWCEHVTLSPPFLERGVTITDASLTRGRDSGDLSGKEFAWPSGWANGPIDLRQGKHSSEFVNNFLVNPGSSYGFFAAFHPRYRLLFGYVFPRSEFPWLNIWESNTADMVTRGMEFSNSPVHGTMKALVQTPKLFGTATFDWLDAKSKLEKRFWAFSVTVPETYKGVADVRVTSSRLEIVERETGKLIRLER